MTVSSAALPLYRELWPPAVGRHSLPFSGLPRVHAAWGCGGVVAVGCLALPAQLEMTQGVVRPASHRTADSGAGGNSRRPLALLHLTSCWTSGARDRKEGAGHRRSPKENTAYCCWRPATVPSSDLTGRTQGRANPDRRTVFRVTPQRCAGLRSWSAGHGSARGAQPLGLHPGWPWHRGGLLEGTGNIGQRGEVLA